MKQSEVLSALKNVPAERGYSVVNKLSDGTFIFTPTQKEADAFILAKQIMRRIGNTTLIILILYLFAAVFILWQTGEGMLFRSLEELICFLWVLLGGAVFWLVCASVFIWRYRKLKRLYRGKVIFYWQQPFKKSGFECH